MLPDPDVAPAPPQGADPDPDGLGAAAEAAETAEPDHPAGLEYELLGLMPPDSIALRVRSGAGEWIGLDLPRAGLYRPRNFRPAPWSGMAYDTAPADGSGLCPGSRVLTMRGEVPVEQLQPTDRVLGLRGPRVAEIAWIGRCCTWPGQGDDAPVRIRAGAFGKDFPARDLVVGPNQVLFPDGAMPQVARDLVQQGLAEPLPSAEPELFQLSLVAYPGAEDGDVLLVDGLFAATREPPAP